jgi:hypothetical protein
VTPCGLANGAVVHGHVAVAVAVADHVNVNVNVNDNDNDNHHTIFVLQRDRQPRGRDGTDSDQRGSSGANRLSAWW